MQHEHDRIELVGGPFDGERRTIQAGQTRYEASTPTGIVSHVYVKAEDGRFRYEGTAPVPSQRPSNDYRNGDL